MRKIVIGLVTLTYMLASPALAHRDGCHRWHSCPSDRGTYVCGDLGYTTYCPKDEPTAQVQIPAAAAPPATDNTRRTTTNLNLRQGPSASSAKLATLKSGTRVNLLGCAASWCRVSVQGKTGYVSQQYLR
ncbi:SH3 domain-containing protein [Deinococcus cavernae]|uniref:SH3 domain-containing protein n=1 Tax=Deinococcus cavernae TaxID=2320857 RepID=A0A418VEG3_9DEIO|nr:SH3 domain-containing protein [Deinococcus cavernae]RJF74494.1 SH3 domain-containing protein [Deinococcus cavernae]